MFGQKTWKDELKERASHRLALKTLVTVGGIAIFFYAYFWVMRHPLSAETVMPLTWIDELIPFSPGFFFLYASLWIYVSLGAVLAGDARELATWGAVSFAMAVIGLGIFMAVPTKVPNAAIDWSQYPSLQFLRTVDVSGNACPSLHVAFAAFTAVVLHRQLRAMRSPQALVACNLLWCLAIVYSTIATRQHVALDVVAGALLAGVSAVAYARAGQRPSFGEG